MNRIATMTVIRGNGACEAFMNGVVREEMLKINAKHDIEMKKTNAALQATTNHRNKLLADRAAALRQYNVRPRSIFSRIKDSIVNAWCLFYSFGWAIGFWKHIDEEEEV